MSTMHRHAPGEGGHFISICGYMYLRRIVNDDSFGEIPAENIEVLDVVAVDTDTVLST